MIGFGCALVGELLLGNPYGVSAGYIFASVVNYAVARRIHRQIKDRTVIDVDTGEKLEVKAARSTLFWIPMEYWSGILIVLGLSIAIFPSGP